MQAHKGPCQWCGGKTVHFHSKREAKRWFELLTLQDAGQITGLERQVKYALKGQNGPLKDFRGKPITAIVDFRYYEDGQLVLEDVKGAITPESELKLAVLNSMLPGSVRVT